MKLVPRRNFPRLGKWIPFFQQIEETSDNIDDIGDIDGIGNISAIDGKEIDATDFQKFCTLIDPTEEDERKEKKEFQDSVVPFRPAPPMPPSRYDRAIDYIKKFGLEKNIILLTSNAPSGESIINGVNFRCLKIKGNVEINFSTLFFVKFVHNTFYDNVKISAPDANKTTVIFLGNKLLESLDLHATNTLLTIIKNNDVFRRMNISFTFIPSVDFLNLIIPNTRLPQWKAKLSDNKVDHLSISDINKTSDWRDAEDDYPLENIEFNGGNRIRILSIRTKYTMLIPRLPLKSDVNRISFCASDKIGFPAPKTDPTSDRKEYGISQEQNNNDMLTYGRFFSLLEMLASKQHDRVTEDMYKRKARYFYRNFLPHMKDRFIFGWTDWVSKDGTSWIRPLLWLTATAISFTIIAHYFLIEWNLHYSWGESWRVYSWRCSK